MQKFSYEGTTTENPNNNDEVSVPGNYQSASGYGSDWTPADAPPLVSENNNDVYTGRVYMDGASEIQVQLPMATWTYRATAITMATARWSKAVPNITV
ncbi:MAG: hypothetical protein U5J63_08650 [Fodinibius sp.]|nr:hypothetical protein [Fodinibius sp.]